MELRLPDLHPAQRLVWDEPARFKVLACGRRWGKSMMGSLACVVDGMRGGRAWWIAPSYKMAMVGWRTISHLGGQVPGADVRLSEMQVAFPGGGSAQVRSADDPQSLRGEGLTFAVLDECAFMREAAWSEAVRPALSDRQGGALFISTPRGRNWFWRLWLRGERGEPDWRSWRFPTVDNPFIPASEIEEARRDMPERTFAQEYLAEFLDDAGGVLRKVRDAAVLQPAAPKADGQYVMGVDWAKSADFTVLVVIDAKTGEMAAMDRFNRIDYSVQRGRLEALANRYRVRSIVAESNAMGEPIVEQLRRDGLPVIGFVTTNASKTMLVEGLALAFEQGVLRILDDPVLVGELEAYEMQRLPSGAIRYGAPEGMHDDTVMALALAWWAASRPLDVAYMPSIYS